MTFGTNFDPDYDYTPNFIQPKGTRQNTELKDILDIAYTVPGELVTSLPGEKWKLARVVEYGKEIILPWYHVSNLGRVISHIRHNRTPLYRSGNRWGYDENRICNGKMKKFGSPNKGKNAAVEDYHWKLFLKVVHWGLLEPIWLDEAKTKQSPSSERQEKDLPIHRLVIDTWAPIYEVDPDVPAEMLEAMRWHSMPKEGKLWMNPMFEVDHSGEEQNSLDNRVFKLRRTTGGDNNRAALIARGGSHGNPIQARVTTSKPKETPTLETFFVK